MKLNLWTLGLTAAGVVSVGSVAYAEEKPMSQVLTAVSGTQISGYVDTSAIWQPGTGNAYLPGRAFDGVGKLDSFNLNVAALTVQKVPGQDNWAAGYRMDLLFGPDAVGYNLAVGNNGLTSNNSDFGIKQAYVDLVMPVGSGLDFKVGTFNTIVGYEVFESYQNSQFSRSFGWQLEPTQHTGLLMSYNFTEAFSFSGGIANTYMSGINTQNQLRDNPANPTIESAKAYMASLTLKAPESFGFLAGSALSAGIVNGYSADHQNTTLFYAGATIKTGVEGLSLGAAYDYRQNGASLAGGAPLPAPATWSYEADNSAYSLAGYLTFKASEHLSFGGRIDWTDGSNGVWYYALDNRNKLVSFTGTIDYQLWANALTRLEFRWDHCASGDKPYGGTEDYNPDTGTGGPTEMNAFTIALNVVYKF